MKLKFIITLCLTIFLANHSYSQLANGEEFKYHQHNIVITGSWDYKLQQQFLSSDDFDFDMGYTVGLLYNYRTGLKTNLITGIRYGSLWTDKEVDEERFSNFSIPLIFSFLPLQSQESL